MRKIMLAAVACTAFASAASPPAHAGLDPFVGEVQTFPFNFCPKGYASLDGQLIPISQNTALFSLLGTTYGGDGRLTFALPTAKPIYTASGVKLIQCIALQGVFPSRP